LGQEKIVHLHEEFRILYLLNFLYLLNVLS